MTESRFYATDAKDPQAPVVMDEFDGLRPGMSVRYVGPRTLEGTFVVTEIIHWADHATTVILNDGKYEVDHSNLVPVRAS